MDDAFIPRGSDRQPTHRDDLPFPERLLLWALRTWVVGLKRRLPVEDTLRTAFCRIGAEETVILIDNLMAVVSHGAARVIEIDCPCRVGISDDEQCLLDAVALYQSGSSLEARFILRSLLTPTASRLAGELLQALAQALTRANLHLRPTALPAGRYCLDLQEEAFPHGTSRMVH